MNFACLLSMSLPNLSGMSIGKIVPLVLLGLFIITVAIGLIKGLSRGIKKQGLHLACTVEAAILAYLIVGKMTQAFIDSFNAATIADLLSKIGMNPAIAEYLDGLGWLLALPFGTLAVPALFVLFFFIVKIGAAIMYSVMRRVLSLPKKERGAANRCSGMAVGAVEAIVCFVIFFMPFISFITMFDSGVDALREKDETAYGEFFDFYDENVDPLVESFTVKATRKLGADAALDSFATVENRKTGEKINLRREVVSAVSIVTETSTMKDVNWRALSKEHQEVLSSTVDTLASSEYLSIIVADMLNGMAAAVENNVVPFKAEPPFDTLIGSVVALFSSVNEQTLGDDIHSILSIYYILCDDGVLSAIGSGDSDALLDCLIEEHDGETIVNKIIAELKKNEHTKPLVATLTELSVTVMSSQLSLGENSAEVYDNVKEGLKDVLSIKPTDYEDTAEGKAQYKEDLTNSLDETLKENGIELDPEIVGGIADYIDENVEVKDEYTDEEINDVILSYYDVYLEYQKNGTLPDGLPEGFPIQ